MEHSPFEIVAYFPEWGGRRQYTVKDIVRSGSAGKIATINYAFGLPVPGDAPGTITCTFADSHAAYARVYTAEESVDGGADDPAQPLRGHFNQLRKLKQQYPHIRLVISLGGWTGSGYFSDAARSVESREQFVSDCMDIFVRGNLPPVDGAGGPGAAEGLFDGIDIDWEYPVRGGLADNHYHPEDAQNFPRLLETFRRQYAATGREDFLLTAALPGPAQADQYMMQDAHPYLDRILAMTYDFVGAWSPLSGHHTNLCPSEFDPAPPEKRASADRTIRIYRDQYGVPAEKLMIGGGFYGRAWEGAPTENHGLFQPARGLESGGLDYFQLKNLPAQGYERHWDPSARAPYLYHPEKGMFYTYDDPESLTWKARYARQAGLAGVFFWEISADDEQGTLVDTIAGELTAPEAGPFTPCGQE